MEAVWLREIGLCPRETFMRECQFHEGLARRLALERVLEGHEGCVNRLAWNNAGTCLASGSDDRKVMRFRGSLLLQACNQRLAVAACMH